jgi:hypothetical protein
VRSAAWRAAKQGRVASTIAGPRRWDGLFRLFAGVAILLSLGNQFPFAIGPDAPFGRAMPLAWVAAPPSRRDSIGALERLAILLIPSRYCKACWPSQ